MSKRNSLWRAPAVFATALALTLGGAGLAHAGTSYAGFNVNVPRFQGAYVGIPSQTKATSHAAGHIRFSAIGSTYKMDARQCLEGGLICNGYGTKVFAIPDDNRVRSLPNTILRGTKRVGVELRVASWNAVNVNARGSWRSN